MPILVFLSAMHVSAQGVQTGAIRGRVVDQQDLPLPGVTVAISSPAQQGPREATTDQDGVFVFRALPAGDYQIAFGLSSFAPLQRRLNVPLGGSIVQNVTLAPAGVSEVVDVVGALAPITTPVVGLNIKHDEVESLATSRTLQGIATLSPALTDNTPNSGQVVINGAFAFDNVFMLNGVDVNDNLFGSPQNLFIEDAIEETQVLTSGISAEYGRFSGGVINAITKSGGNLFAGSYRLNLTNPAWAVETPFEVANGALHTSTFNRSHEATFGGPIARDRLWFFTAGRLSSIDTQASFNQTGVPYTDTDDNRRGEAKLTATVKATHTIQAGYANNHRKLKNTPSFDYSIDAQTLGAETTPNWYTFANYRGVFGSRLLAEGQYSERRYSFIGVGGTSTAIIDSPFFTLTQDLGHYNARYFDASDPEERNNRQVTGNITYVAEGGGRHEIKSGYEWFRSQNTGGNSQSATGYVFDADYVTDPAGRPVPDGNGDLIPVFTPGETMLENWLAVRGATLNVDTQSVYAQDHWAINRRLTADLGVRYERVRSEATGGIVGVDTDTLVPRLAAAYDVAGDGGMILHATYGHYAGRYNEAQIGVNSNVGNPDETVGLYAGPAGQGRGFAPGFDPANYDIASGKFPTANVSFAPGLTSPLTREFTVSADAAVGRRAHAEVSYVWRRTSRLIEDFIDQSNGFTAVARNGTDFGVFTNVVYRNTSLAKRRYQGLVLQGRFALGTWTVNGFWTIQLRNEGNYEGENANQPGAPSVLGDFPEAFSAERNYPFGRLQDFQRHRVRLWTIRNFESGRLGHLSVSGLLRVESGRVDSLNATNQPVTPEQQALLTDYPDAPSSQTVYFGERGSQTFPGYGVIDASLNYDIRAFRALRPWLKLDVFNVFNNLKVIGFDTTVTQDAASPVDALGLHTGYVRGPSFGQATSNADFPQSLNVGSGRTFRVSLGLRF
ncbi:MAG: TonB-dependent receptor [Acidobacteriota bacterium]